MSIVVYLLIASKLFGTMRCPDYDVYDAQIMILIFIR